MLRTYLSRFIYKYHQGIFFNLCVISFGFWLLGQWPGFYIYDTFTLINAIDSSQTSGWQSYIYSLYISFIFFFSKNLVLAGILQIFCFSAIFTWIHSWAIKRGSPIWISFIFLFLLIISPINGIFTLFYNRDPLHAWLNILLAFLVYQQLYQLKPRATPKFKHILVVCILTSILAELRQDAVILIPTVCLIYWFYYPNKKIFLLQLLLPMTLSFLIICKIIPVYLNAENTPTAYKITGMLNPLGYILKNIPRDKINRDTKNSIEEVVLISDLTKYHSDYEIPVFHKGLVRLDISSDQFYLFSQAYITLISQHPFLFLENRLKMFLSIIAVNNNYTMFYADDLFNYNILPEKHIQTIKKYNIYKTPVLKIFRRLQLGYAFNLIRGKYGSLTQIVLASGLLGLIISLLALFMFKRLPLSSAFASIILSRIIVVFLSAPASQFKYTYSLLLCSTLLPVLIICELKRKVLRKEIL